MQIGLRQLLLLASTIIFVVSIFVEDSYQDWLSIGLACLAGAFLVGEMGWDRQLNSGTRT